MYTGTFSVTQPDPTRPVNQSINQ